MDRHYLLLALAEARKRHGFTHPNPAVGAALVKGNKVIGTGFHQGVGHAHAEADLLSKVSPEDCVGATLYVTLEPCCAFESKRTAACAELIVSKGIREVVYGCLDPNPKVAGAGAKYLESHGVGVRCVEVAEIQAHYRSYVHWTNRQRPFIIGKLALSLDGKIAGEGGRPVKLTSEEADALTQKHRKEASAILTTAKTVALDNPRLNARLETVHSKMVFVVDPRLEISASSKIFSETGPVILICGENAPDRTELDGVQLLRMPLDSRGMMNPSQMMQTIGAIGAHELWVEAGGTLFCDLIQNQLMDEAFLYLTPHWLGEKATPAFRKINPVASAKSVAWSELGPDALCHLIYSDN